MLSVDPRLLSTEFEMATACNILAKIVLPNVY